MVTHFMVSWCYDDVMLGVWQCTLYDSMGAPLRTLWVYEAVTIYGVAHFMTPWEALAHFMSP